METYSYEATTRDGRILTGTIEAADEHMAIDRIQDMGYFPLKVSRVVARRDNILGRLFSSLQRGPKGKDITNLTYQLGVLLDAGFPVDKALSILSGLTKASLRELIEDIVAQIRGGKTFSEALSRFPSAFPPFYVNMVRAGEAGGFLEDTISRLAGYLENTQALKEDIRSALIYPIILSIMGGAAVVVLLTFVVPKFTRIFTDMGEALPLPTVVLLGISKGLRDYWWIILLLFIGLGLSVRYYLRTDSGRRLWDRLRFRLPVFGKLFREAAVSRFARTLGTLLGSGVPLLNALQIVKGTLGSERMAEVISTVRDDVRKGSGISGSLRNSDIFPPIAIHMIAVGEESGRLDEMLLKIADRFDLEVRTTVKRLLSLLEPALILVMGVMVGFIVIAMLMAIFSINELPF